MIRNFYVHFVRFVGMLLPLWMVVGWSSVVQGQFESPFSNAAPPAETNRGSTAEIYRSHNGLRIQEAQQSQAAVNGATIDPRPKQSFASSNHFYGASNQTDVRQATWTEPIKGTSEITSDVQFQSESSRLAIPLKPPTDSSGKVRDRSRGWLGNLLSMVFSLTVVLGIFLALVWFVRKSGVQTNMAVHNDVVEVLGRSVLAPRQQLYVVRFGGKLLLISHQLGQTQTLSEIDNPDEVERLASLCKEPSRAGLTKSFSQVFQDMTSKPLGGQRDSFLRMRKSGSSKELASKG